MIKLKVIYSRGLPQKSHFSNSTILFYDQKVIQNSYLKKWITQFPFALKLKAGETLKTGSSYLAQLEKVQKIVTQNNLSSTELTFLALGGGSVGDFVGFLASTYQRGKRLVIIPTTWLAAIDSAHGGKNGLNLNFVKNQIGTFYPPHEIYLSQKVLTGLTQNAVNDALSEALKMGIINDSQLFISLKNNFKSLWKHLPRIVQRKYKIVHLDPHEKKGLRRVLNLGHTMGHVFESIHQLPHGQAVFLGILFSARFSLYKNYLSWNQFLKILDQMFLIECDLSYQDALQMPLTEVEKLLKQDKKIINDGLIDFIFIRKIGKVDRQSISVMDVISEIKRQQKEI